MTASESISLIGALAAFIAAISSAIAAITSSRNLRTLLDVKHQTNSLVEKLGETKLAQGIAEGTAQGLEQGRQEAVK